MVTNKKVTMETDDEVAVVTRRLTAGYFQSRTTNKLGGNSTGNRGPRMEYWPCAFFQRFFSTKFDQVVVDCEHIWVCGTDIRICRNCAMFGRFFGPIIGKYVQPAMISWMPGFAGLYRYAALIPLEYGYTMPLESILWAAPKKKTSYSKKRMRQATKGLRDIQHLNYCSACGKKKLAHTLCLFCYKEIKEFIKSRCK
ncbi:hypothetical protein MERGE_000711 [Pneumocystis wakefieldiae]|uniref:Large ribosomal subunit protein bL32m n=1 Tax=Pneumocystis wakefieldiae TaxID=38082 RepID=A0A899G0K2_9ASCO|nr:hypothetical protein MERGE_000711 [Pneumocystis wakefieldiae]